MEVLGDKGLEQRDEFSETVRDRVATTRGRGGREDQKGLRGLGRL